MSAFGSIVASTKSTILIDETAVLLKTLTLVMVIFSALCENQLFTVEVEVLIEKLRNEKKFTFLLKCSQASV